jgi:hypothetical protein
MARHSLRTFIGLAGISALAEASYAAPPPTFCVTSNNNNTACGSYTLLQTSGAYNSAFGEGALRANENGIGNTGSGAAALNGNLSGSYNTATGAAALLYNTTGSYNTASGRSALHDNTTGVNNTAVGYQALYASTTANYTTGIGYEALYNSQSGLANIGVGPFAGRNIIQGELNIDIGSWGSVDESNTIRIGISPYHAHTYIAGIYSTTGLSGLPVIVTSSGQLGVDPVSSERFKTGIATMGSATENLSQLRPVTFKLKSDARGTVHYGLIAEEVAKVYPELAIRDQDGRIDGLHYDELAPMLLNEMKKEQTRVDSLLVQHEMDAAKIASLEQQIARVDSLERELADLHAALASLQSRDPLAATR